MSQLPQYLLSNFLDTYFGRQRLMELNFSWLAMRGAEAETIYRLLALAPTGEFAAAPAGEFSLAHLPGDWHLVFSQRFDYADHTPLAELSSGGELITCCVNEPLMYSSISGWRDGTRLWYFVHDGGLGIQHRHVEGDPPPEFHEIANHLAVVQAEGEGIAISVDHIIEIAPQVAQVLTGFSHEESCFGDIEKPFERLKPA